MVELPYQIASHSQPPFGNHATTSTRPYLILFFPFVFRRADLIGLIILPVMELLSASHATFVTVPVSVSVE